MAFEAVTRVAGDVAVIDLAGDLNRDAEEVLEAAYTEAAVRGPSVVLLNFGAVHYINSTGIALIVGLLARARKVGLTVRACGLTPHYQELFEITRLSDFVAIFPDEASAVATVAT